VLCAGLLRIKRTTGRRFVNSVHGRQLAKNGTPSACLEFVDSL
jgi:hypothetical protein